MEISKTQFKELSLCDRVLSLNDIYLNKMESIINISDKQKYLLRMFDDLGNDLVYNDQFHNVDEKLEEMNCYYQKVEEICLKEASRIFAKEFLYSKDTLKQKKFSFNDSSNTLYTYLDGYYEDDNNVYIIEVKAKTDKIYKELGPKVKGTIDSIFTKSNQIMTLKNNLTQKMLPYLNKLYNRFNEVGKYFFDLAITSYIIKRSKKVLNKKVYYYLGVLNSSYVYDGSLINNEPSYFNGSENLFTFIDATKILDNYYDYIDRLYNMIILSIDNLCLTDSKYKIECDSCKYKNICFPELKEPNNITTLIGLKKEMNLNKYELFNNNIKYIKDLNRDMIKSNIHLIQYDCILNNNPFKDNDLIKNQLDKIKYPIYHLDFESFQSPLPRFKGEIPYTQSVFQFSIHIEKNRGVCDEIKDNYYFIPNDFLDHRLEMVEELIRIIDLTNGGTVLVYNKQFEYNRLKELKKIYPEYDKEITTIMDNIFDLMDVVKGVEKDRLNYYNALLDGSYSIKKVLPVFSSMSYKNLEIHNGNEAIINYAKFSYLDSFEIEIIRKNLIKYCGQDTYSMFVILNKLMEVCDYGK